MLLRANVLAKGFSGVRPETLELLVGDAQRAASIRSIPSQGSVGASGDLAPLAHLALALVGEGECAVRGPAACPRPRRCAPPGLAPVVLRGQGRPGPHQRHAAHDRGRRARARRGAGASRARADVAGRAHRSTRSRAPTSPSTRASTRRGRTRARRASARNLRALLAGSAIRESHRDCGKVQDAYSLRCMPQVHGAARDALALRRRARSAIEMNAATDNPMVFAETRRAALGRQLPRRAGGHRRRRAGHRGGRARRHQRAAHRAAGEPALSGLPAFLTARRRPAARAYDRAGHRGRARLREQGRSPIPRASTRSPPRPTRRTTSRWA